MKRLLNYVPLHFLVCLILGINMQYFFKVWSFGISNLVLILSFIVVSFFALKHKANTTLFSWCFFLIMGISSVYFANDVNYQNYYGNYITENSYVTLKVKKVLKSSNYSNKYQAKVFKVDGIKTKGILLLNVKKDSIESLLKVDELIYVKQDFRNILPPLNPHQFDYKSYLERQGIYQQLYIENKDYKKLRSPDISLLGFSAKMRNYIQCALQEYNFQKDELAVISALLLGQRQDISKDLINDYSRAGAIHILAVSGLHVGIILLILNWLFKPVEYLKNGNFLKTIIVVLFLWAFAFIAGLSASVVRAVTMFTFVAIAMSFRQRSFVTYSLITSMFFLLLVKPMFLFEVGFQLSYLAVFGIVWVQPKLYRIWRPKYKFIDKLWQLTTVSIAAQVGILPLSLYYFHQFPGLFIVSNLMIIPFLGVILFGGILVIVFALIGILPQVLANTYGFVIGIMNRFVGWISNQEKFLFTEIPLSFLKMIGLYLVIVLVVDFLLELKPKKMILALFSIIVLQGIVLFENDNKLNKKEFIVFHKSRNSIIGNRRGRMMSVYHDLNSKEIEQQNTIINYRIGEDVMPTFTNDFPNIINYKNQQVLVVDSLGIYQLNKIKNPIIVLQFSPKINLERMIKSMRPKQIIADGSNYKSYVNRWLKTSQKMGIPIYYTGEKGAFVLKE